MTDAPSIGAIADIDSHTLTAGASFSVP